MAAIRLPIPIVIHPDKLFCYELRAMALVDPGPVGCVAWA